MNTLKAFWTQHGQKTLATLLAALAVVDMTPYETDLHDLVPWKHWHAVLRLGAAVGIFWRAMQSNKNTAPIP